MYKRQLPEQGAVDAAQVRAAGARHHAGQLGGHGAAGGLLGRGGALCPRAVGLLWAGAVAAGLDRVADLRVAERVAVVFHHHGVLQQIDRHRRDAGQLAHAFFHVGAAGGAGHAGHVEFLFHSHPILSLLGRSPAAGRRERGLLKGQPFKYPTPGGCISSIVAANPFVKGSLPEKMFFTGPRFFCCRWAHERRGEEEKAAWCCRSRWFPVRKPGEPGTGNSAGQKTGGDGDLTGEAERIIMTKIKK